MRSMTMGLFAIVALFAVPAKAESAEREFALLTKQDYKALTGCETGFYRPILAHVLPYLAFPESRIDNHPDAGDIAFAQRRGRYLFRSLLREFPDADGALQDRCLPPSLRAVALELRLLSADGRFRNEEMPTDHVYDTAVASAGTPSPKAYPVMTRQLYIKRTGCLVSPSTWDKLRRAFVDVVFAPEEHSDPQRETREAWMARGRTRMIDFLQDLHDSRPTPERYVQDRCMIEAVSRIAGALGLLDDAGRYKVPE